MKKISLFFTILLFFATIPAHADLAFVPADMDNGYPEYVYFNTMFVFNNDFGLSALDPDYVASGDPDDLEGGDQICSGAELTLSPNIVSNWAFAGDVQIRSAYPECTHLSTYCPLDVIHTGSTTSNARIVWLSEDVFDAQAEYGRDHLFATDYSIPSTVSRYLELQPPLTQQRVTYVFTTRDPVFNMRGYADIFCKGDLRIQDMREGRGTVIDMADGTDDLEINLDLLGAHEIRTQLENVECFGAVVKDPVDNDNPEHYSFFYLYYYAQNTPDIPSPFVRETTTISVVESAGDCNIGEMSIMPSPSLTDPEHYVVRMVVHNYGDPVIITDVSTSDHNFVVGPMDPALCHAPDFDPADCPPPGGSNGFGVAIPRGRDVVLYLDASRIRGSSRSFQITLHAETVSGACGGPGECDEDARITFFSSGPGDTVPASCEIDPASLDIGSYEIGEFEVTCYNTLGVETPCTGSDWSIEGFSGEFLAATSEYAHIYPRDSPGASGLIRYTSGDVTCTSDIDVVSPDYVCEFDPRRATLDHEEFVDFDLVCSVSGARDTPDFAEYDLTRGLVGSTRGRGPRGITGATYTAPDRNTAGDLRGAGYWETGEDIIGAVAIAGIVVNNDSGLPPDEGGSDICEINGGNPLDVYAGQYGWVSIHCGEDGDIACSSVDWDTPDHELAELRDPSNDHGTGFYITGEVGEEGEISASVGEEECSIPFTVSSLDCWEVS